jgi:hypothetical protein
MYQAAWLGTSIAMPTQKERNTVSAFDEPLEDEILVRRTFRLVTDAADLNRYMTDDAEEAFGTVSALHQIIMSRWDAGDLDGIVTYVDFEEAFPRHDTRGQFSARVNVPQSGLRSRTAQFRYSVDVVDDRIEYMA